MVAGINSKSRHYFLTESFLLRSYRSTKDKLIMASEAITF